MMVLFAKRRRPCEVVYQQDMHSCTCSLILIISFLISCFPLMPCLWLPYTEATASRHLSPMVASVRRRRALPPDSALILPLDATPSTPKALEYGFGNGEDDDGEGRLEQCKACAVCGKPNGKACVKCNGGAFYCDKDCQR